MAIYTVELDGQILELEGPDNAKPEDVEAAAREAVSSQQPKQEKGLLASMKEDAPEIAGSVAGGVVAAPAAAAATAVGGPAAGMAVEAIGSGIGQAAGDAGKQIYEHITGSEKAPKTSGEAINRLKDEFMAGAVSVPVGKAVGKVAQKALAPFASRMNPVMKEIGAKIKEFGGQVLPSQMGDSKILQMMESFARGGILSGDELAKVDVKNKEAIGKYASKVAEKLSGKNSANLSNAEIGTIFKESINAGKDAFHAVANQLYDDVDNKLGFAAVSTEPLKQATARIAADFGNVAGIGKSEAAGTLIDRVDKLGESVKFADMQFLRSMILEDLRAATLSRDGGKIKVLSELAKAVDGAMETASTKLAPEAQAAWRSANEFYRTGKETFENTFMRNVMKDSKAVEKIGRSIYHEGNVDAINRVKKALSLGKLSDENIDIQKTMGALKQGFFRDLIESNIDQAGNVNFEAIMQNLSESRLDETATALLSREEATAVKEFVEVGMRVMGDAGKQSAPFQFAQFAAVSQLFGAATAIGSDDKKFKVGGLALLAAPTVMAKALTHPVTAQYLTQGIVELADKGITKKALMLATKVGAALKANDNED